MNQCGAGKVTTLQQITGATLEQYTGQIGCGQQYIAQIIFYLMSESEEIKNKKKHKHDKNREPDFTYWTDEQKKSYNDAKNEFEREQIFAEVSRRLEDEEYKNKVLQMHKRSFKSDKDRRQKDEHDINDDKLSESSDDDDDDDDDDDSYSSQKHSHEEGEVRNSKQKRKVEVEEQPKAEESIDAYELGIRNIVLKRSQICNFLMKRYYDDVLEQAFVRIQEPSMKGYALAQIIGFAEQEKPYQLEQSQTYKLLKLQFAQFSQHKYRHITIVSNQKLDKQEYVVWKKLSEEKGLPLPTKEFLVKKHKDIIRATTTKMTDEQIEKKIITTIQSWTTTQKQNILYNDLPNFLHFLRNQQTIQKQTIDKLDEFRQEIMTDAIDGQTKQIDMIKLTPEDRNKVIKLDSQKQESQIRINILEKEIDKIKTLYSKNEQKLKIKQEEQQNQKPLFSQIPLPSSQIPQLHTNKEQKESQNQKDFMRNLDDKYNRNRIFEDVYNIDGSEKMKANFIQVHQRALEIDEIIDNMMDTES